MRALVPLVALAAAAAAWWLLQGSARDEITSAAARSSPTEEAAGTDLRFEAGPPETARPRLTGAGSGSRGRGAQGRSGAESPVQAPKEGATPPAALGPVRVAGIVRDEHGQPVADAEVRAPGVDVVGVSNAEGRFEMELPPPGAFALVAARPRQPEVRLYPVLDRAPALWGRVIDAVTREPLEGVRVEARPSSAPASARPATHAMTDAQGAFELLLADTGDHDLQALPLGPPTATVPEGFRPGRLSRVRAKGPAAPVEIALERGLEIEGRLLDEQGEVLRGPASVQAIAIAADGSLDYTRMLGGRATDGRLHLGGLAPGAYQVTVTPLFEFSADDQVFGRATLARVEAGTRGLEIRLPRGRWLEGVVVGAQREALAAR